MMMLFSVPVFAAGVSSETLPTEISVTIQGVDNALTRSTGYGNPAGSTDIIDDNHAFDEAVEVWGVSKTWLRIYSSDTPNGIPDWTLMAMCQLWVSNGDFPYVVSPTASVYDKTSVSATTKKVHARDGGSANATGSHTVKEYGGAIVWTDESEAYESF